MDIGAGFDAFLSRFVSRAPIKSNSAGGATDGGEGGGKKKYTGEELLDLYTELQIRELAFWTCANMMGNLLSRCEFRTYMGGKEVQDAEYYTWNVEPSKNQSSTAMRQKMVALLYKNNEILMIPTQESGGRGGLVVADSFNTRSKYVKYPNIYDGVVVDGYTYDRTFPEDEVLHIKLFHQNMRPVINGIYVSYQRMIAASMKNFEWQNGKHFKVHVEGMAAGEDGWEKKFQEMMDEQMRPFVNSNSAILPEFDGYLYEDMAKNYTTQANTRDIRALADDVLDFTARGFLFPTGVFSTTAEGKREMMSELFTWALNPLAGQLSEEITRKRYGYEGWKKQNYLRIDTSTVRHFDLFENAANIDKLIASGGYSINDIKRATGQPRIDEPWADMHFMTKNYELLQNVMNALGGGE